MNILDLIKKIPKYQKLINRFVSIEKPVQINNFTSNLQKLLICEAFRQKTQNIVVVYPNIFYANQAYEDFSELLSEQEVSFFPVEEFIVGELVASSSSFRIARMNTIIRMIKKIPQIIITSTEGLTHHIMSKTKIEDSFLTVKVGDIISIKQLTEELVTRGYKKTPITEVAGTFSVRGSIVDVFIIGNENPTRIDFFDNEIETIKGFSVETQRSFNKVDLIEIYPMYELYYQLEEITTIKEKIIAKNPHGGAKIDKALTNLENYNNLEQMYLYLPYIDCNFISFIELMENKTLYLNEYKMIMEKEFQNINEITEYLIQNPLFTDQRLFESIEDIISKADEKTVYMSQFSGLKEELKGRETIDYKTSANIDYNNDLRRLVSDVMLNSDKYFIITHEDVSKLRMLKELFDNEKISFETNDNDIKLFNSRHQFLIAKNALGFDDYELGLTVITPLEFASGKITKHYKYQRFYNQSVKIYNKDDLAIGDYVVHREYGIGKYLGIKTIELNNKNNDYLLLGYAEESKLYIPIESIHVLEKYIGNTDKTPRLSKAGSKEWMRKKDRIKARMVDIAKDLIRVQAERESLKGVKYAEDSPEQALFEEDFGFIETPGQVKAIEDVKKDLESERPMDRLICGDVGFGKTEVAMRAAFKVVENGRQVAYLTPTTVLCRQQYISFKERFEKYGARVEQLSRFVDYQTTKTVLSGMQSGYVDIVVGTHRLLSNDIKFKNLGLLIIDEEHRFGVEHKERIKQLKANIDVISLSATPIPRTLQMSLSGLRDLSLIDTPPINRVGVQTYVLPKEDAVIREAIHRELGRGGQVFYLLNRISLLDNAVAKITKLVPFAKIGVVHGKMDKEDIESVLNQFIEKELNVLLCTTIIETGINIPNANTIIIERADTLGLAQIYQIRGRVGRSDKIAYAYLMYEKNGVLTETALKRLETIKQFTELGSGYKVAMRDLSIRGAGDILGKEQSGFINDIGIELYMHLLNEVVEEQKGIVKTTDQNGRNYPVNISKHISPDYVMDDSIRITMHNEICKVYSRENCTELINEFKDRFGRITDELKIYVHGKYLEYLLKTHGVESYKETANAVEFNFEQEKTKQINYPMLLGLANKIAVDYRFEYKFQKIFVRINLNTGNTQENEQHYIYKLVTFLENLK